MGPGLNEPNIDQLEEFFANNASSPRIPKQHVMLTAIKEIISQNYDLIWLTDTQTAGYFYLDCLYPHMNTKRIALTLYGNDVYFYRNNRLHTPKIASLLSKVNILHSETSRDIKIAKELGFKGAEIYGVTASFDTIGSFALLNSKKSRKYIVVHGSDIRRQARPFILSYIEQKATERRYDPGCIRIIRPSKQDMLLANSFSALFSQIIGLPWMTQKDLEGLFSNTSYYIHDTLSDGTAITCIQAALCGSLVLTTPGNGFTELIPTDISNFLVKPDSLSFIDMINSLEEMGADKRNSIIIRLQKNVSNILNREKVHEKLLRLLKNSN